MQNFEQVKDVIQYSKSIHERLEKTFRLLNEKERPERERMLLVYLIENQVHIGEVLSNFESVSEQSILNSWMQFTPDVELHQSLDALEPQVELSFEEIMHFSDLYSHEIIEFYNVAANETELPKVKMIFENLKKMAIQGNRQQDDAALFKAM